MSVNALGAKCIGWPPSMRQAHNALVKLLRSISAVVGLKSGSLFHQGFLFILFPDKRIAVFSAELSVVLTSLKNLLKIVRGR